MHVPTPLDFLYLCLTAVALPLWDYLFWWPAFRRRYQAEPAHARRRLWRSAIAFSWFAVALGCVIWAANERPWATLGFTAPVGWRIWAAIGVILLLATYYAVAVTAVARDPASHTKVKSQFTGDLVKILPRTRRDLGWFSAVAVTAGFCEELLYRGLIIGMLTSWLGWWLAASLSLVGFALAHAYQGWSGIVRTSIAGAVLTALVVTLGSLWPAMIVHALMDLAGGVIAWLVLRPSAGANAK